MLALRFNPDFPGEYPPLVRLRSTVFQTYCIDLTPDIGRLRIGSMDKCEIHISYQAPIGDVQLEIFSRVHAEIRLRSDYDEPFFEITNGYAWPGQGYQPSSNGLWLKKPMAKGIWLPNKLDPIRLEIGDRIAFGRGIEHATAVVVANCNTKVPEYVWKDGEWPTDMQKRHQEVVDLELYARQMVSAQNPPNQIESFRLGPSPWYAQLAVLLIQAWIKASTRTRFLTLALVAMIGAIALPSILLAIMLLLKPYLPLPDSP